MINFQYKVNFIWNNAEKLRGAYKKEQYGNVILPMCVLRRFYCVLSHTKEAVLSESEKFKSLPEEAREQILIRVSKESFFNTSKYDFSKLLNYADNISDNLREYSKLY